MKKVKYYVEEKLTFIKEIEVELSDDISMEKFMKLTDIAERHGETVEDIAYNLEKYPGVDIIKFPDNDYSSPMTVEAEYYDHNMIEDSE